MNHRTLLATLTLLSMATIALAQFPETTQQLGGHGVDGGDGGWGDIGVAGAGGVPSGYASVRNGGTGGPGGDGGDGGQGGNGGNGVWRIMAHVILGVGSSLQVGGNLGVEGLDGYHYNGPYSGGDGGFANWPAFAGGQDGEGPEGGHGSHYTGVPGGDAGIVGGGGGGSSGPSGLIQIMSNGGQGAGGSGANGAPGSPGSDGLSASVQTSTDLTLTEVDLQVGGDAGDGGYGGCSGWGGDGGGGAGGGGTWPAGLGGSGGAYGNVGVGGIQGSVGEGTLEILEGCTFSNQGDIYLTWYGEASVAGIFRNELEGYLHVSRSMVVDQGALINAGHMEIISSGELSNQGSVSNQGTITCDGTIVGDVESSGIFEGQGNVIGALVNQGSVSPGEGMNASTLQVQDLETSGELRFHIFVGDELPDFFDRLTIGNNLVIQGGTLAPEFILGSDESDLTDGEYYDLIRTPSPVAGRFDSIDDSLAPVTAGQWVIEYNRDLGDGWYSIRLKYAQGESPVPDSDVPAAFALEGVFPNPCNPRAVVRYALPRASGVRFGIYDLTGRLVWARDDGTVLPAGRHEFAWNGVGRHGRALPSGTYLLKMTAEGFDATRKVALVR